MIASGVKTFPSPSIRAAVPNDAAAVAEVHVTSWREAYAGLMPDTVLANLSFASRAARWQTILSQPDAFDGTVVFVAERNGAVVGFASGGEQRASELRDQGFTAEISAIYVLSAAQGSGVGSSLMARLAQVLVGRGHRAASLWVLCENAPARRFYNRLGGEVVGKKEERREDAALIEVAYGWRDLNRLLTSVRSGEHTKAG